MPRTLSLWCETKAPGETEHSFSSKRGYVVITRQIIEGNGETSLEDDLTLCPRHAEMAGMMPGKSDASVVNGELEA